MLLQCYEIVLPSANRVRAPVAGRRQQVAMHTLRERGSGGGSITLYDHIDGLVAPDILRQPYTANCVPAGNRC